MYRQGGTLFQPKTHTDVDTYKNTHTHTHIETYAYRFIYNSDANSCGALQKQIRMYVTYSKLVYKYKLAFEEHHN